MKNAILIAMEYAALLPQHEIPFCTEKREGFYHLGEFEGTVENAVLSYLLRDHDYAKLKEKEEMMRNRQVLTRLYPTTPP